MSDFLRIVPKPGSSMEAAAGRPDEAGRIIAGSGKNDGMARLRASVFSRPESELLSPLTRLTIRLHGAMIEHRDPPSGFAMDCGFCKRLAAETLTFAIRATCGDEMAFASDAAGAHSPVLSGRSYEGALASAPHPVEHPVNHWTEDSDLIPALAAACEIDTDAAQDEAAADLGEALAIVAGAVSPLGGVVSRQHRRHLQALALHTDARANDLAAAVREARRYLANRSGIQETRLDRMLAKALAEAGQ